jgi:hypothetical protein
MIRNNGMAAIANISGMASLFHLPSRTWMVPLEENQAPEREADKRLFKGRFDGDKHAIELGSSLPGSGGLGRTEEGFIPVKLCEDGGRRSQEMLLARWSGALGGKVDNLGCAWLQAEHLPMRVLDIPTWVLYRRSGRRLRARSYSVGDL